MTYGIFSEKRVRLLAGVLALAGALAVLPAGLGFARGGGHGPGGGGFGGGFGGNSSGHVGAGAVRGSNGPNSPDRDFGLDRAEDRMNREGREHNKAFDRNRGDYRGGESLSVPGRGR